MHKQYFDLFSKVWGSEESPQNIYAYKDAEKEAGRGK